MTESVFVFDRFYLISVIDLLSDYITKFYRPNISYVPKFTDSAENL